MERRHAKGPSLAIGTILGSVGGGTAGGLTPAGLLGASGAALGTSVAGSLEVFPFFGIADNIGLWINTVLNSFINSGLGSIGTSSGSLSGFLTSPSVLPASDSLANSAFNSFNSLLAGPVINSLISLL